MLITYLFVIVYYDFCCYHNDMDYYYYPKFSIRRF